MRVVAFLFLAATIGLSQDFVQVMQVSKEDSKALQVKYSAYEKAKAEWESLRAKVQEKHVDKGHFYKVKFSEDFTIAIPDYDSFRYAGATPCTWISGANNAVFADPSVEKNAITVK